MQIIKLKVGEGSLLKDLWLQMYADSPTAFGGTLAEMQQRPDEGWSDFAAYLATSAQAVAFVPYHEGKRCGFVAGYNFQVREGQTHYDRTDIVTLSRMWVDPTKRRMGIAQAMIEAVIAWAKDLSAEQVELWVTRGNESAIELYKHAGFQQTQIATDLPSQPGLLAELMVLNLAKP